VEATKKTSTTRAALLVLAALSMLLSGLFIATASRSDASPPPACPAGFNLTADGKNCFQAAVVTTADNPNSCVEGLITPDGTTCYVAARIIPQEGQTLCPKGYSPDTSLNAMCARFEPATLLPASCPDGAFGTAGACYINVARGPAGPYTCPTGSENTGTATVPSTTCKQTGKPAIPNPLTPGTCPVSDTVTLDGSSCYTVVAPKTTPGNCTGAGVAPYQMIESKCKVVNTAGTTTFTCPAPADPTIGTVVEEKVTHPNDGTKIAFCILNLNGTTSCPTSGDTPVPAVNPTQCRREVNRTQPGLVCPDAGYAIQPGTASTCVRYFAAGSALPSCPLGSYNWDLPTTIPGAQNSECRKTVTNAPSQYTCKDAAAALSGKSCVFTTGFLINPSPNLYKCEKGVRTVIGSGATTQILCLVGKADANTTTGPSCLQGVLSTDNLYCIVPRIDTAPAAGAAAPVPAFTG